MWRKAFRMWPGNQLILSATFVTDFMIFSYQILIVFNINADIDEY